MAYAGPLGQIAYPTPSGQPTVVGTVTNYVWASNMLGKAGLPQTPNNVLNVVRWMTAEEPASDWYHANNPLNINAGGTGYDTFPSLDAASTRTAQYLAMPNYVNVRAALANNADFSTFAAAVIASPWASGHYGGHLPNGTPPEVSVNGAQLSAGVAGTNQGTSTAGQATYGGCNPSGGIDLLGAHIGTGCQIKGLVGGLCIGFGVAMMIGGAFIISGRSQQVQAVGKQVAKGIAPEAGLAIDAWPTEEPETEGPPPPRNRRQADRQAEDLFTSLGISRPMGATDDAPF